MVSIKKLLVYGGLGLASAFTLYHFWPKSANHEAEEPAEVAKAPKPYKEKVDVLESIIEKKSEPSSPEVAPKEKPKDVFEGIIQKPAAKKPNDILEDVVKPKKDVLERIILKDKHKKEVPPPPKEPAYAPSQPEPAPKEPTYAPAPSVPAEPSPKKEIAPMQLPSLEKYCKLLIDERVVADVRLLPEDSLFRVIYVKGTTELHPQLFMAKDADSYMFDGKNISQQEFVKRVAQVQREGEKYIRRKSK